MRKSYIDAALLFLKGMGMGAADVVPGVSGGTVAFITGIYDDLLGALNKLTPMALLVWYRSGFKAFWRAIDGTFLTLLFGGVFFSIFSLAHAVEHAQQHYPLLVWGFFTGLIIAATLYLVRDLAFKRVLVWLAFIVGVLVALAISVLKPTHVEVNGVTIFLAGAIAICAMILPGISGSFLLLIMGMYQTVLRFITQLDLVNLSIFLAGCITGLLIFSHVLSWLLRHFRQTTLATLSGFLAGSLVIVWPWKHVLETITDRHGEIKPLLQENVLPWQYEAITGQPAQLYTVLALAVAGFLLVMIIDYVSSLFSAKK